MLYYHFSYLGRIYDCSFTPLIAVRRTDRMVISGTAFRTTLNPNSLFSGPCYHRRLRLLEGIGGHQRILVSTLQRLPRHRPQLRWYNRR